MTPVTPVAPVASGDLEARVLRTIGPPERRFAEDHLRLLRAIKFAARCGLEVDAATAAAARAAAGELATLSPERAFAELTEMFVGPGRGKALELFVQFGFAAVLLPEVAAMDGVTQPPEYHPEGDVLTHVALVLGHVPANDPVLAWSAVLHDIGKPPTWREAEDRIRFDGHDVLSAKMAADVLRRFRASGELIETVGEICRDHIRFAALRDMRPRRRERWLRSAHFDKHLAFHRADCLGSHGKLEIHDFAARELAGSAAGSRAARHRQRRPRARGRRPASGSGESSGKSRPPSTNRPWRWTVSRHSSCCEKRSNAYVKPASSKPDSTGSKRPAAIFTAAPSGGDMAFREHGFGF